MSERLLDVRGLSKQFPLKGGLLGREAGSDLTCLPSKSISPDVGSIRRSTQRPVVDLPQPDSPTSPSVSPRAISKSTPSTARTLPA